MAYTENGIEPQTFAELVNQYEATLTDNLADLGLAAPDFDATPDGAYADTTATLAFEVWDALRLLAESQDPLEATGANFWRVAARAGIFRRAGSKSRYEVTATASTGLEVNYPAGSLVQGGGSSGTARWQVVADTTVTDAGTAVTIEAVAEGPTTLASGSPTTLTRITRIAGIESVVYTPSLGAAFAVGRDVESVVSGRARLRRQLASQRGPSVPGLRASILQDATFVTAVSIAASTGSIAVTVVPSPVGADQIATLAEAIAENVAAGIATTGTSSTTYTYSWGDTDTISYSAGSTDARTVSTTIVVESSTSLAAVTPSVREAIEGYFAGLEVGEVLRWSDLYCAIVEVDGVQDVTALDVGGGAATSPGDTIAPASTDLIVLDGDATVTT